MQCVHRKAADVRWRFFPLLVLLSVSALSASADDTNTTLQASPEVVPNLPLTETPTLQIKSTSTPNETSTIKPHEVSTKSIVVPPEIPEGTTNKSEVASEKVVVSVITNSETAGKQVQTLDKKREETHNETTEKPAVTAEERVETAEKRDVTEKIVEVTTEKLAVTAEERVETAEKRDVMEKIVEVTTEKLAVTAEERVETAEKRDVMEKIVEVTTEKLAVTAEERVETAEKRDVTEKIATVTTEKLHDEESQTESASELALQSVQLAVVVKAPKRHGVKTSIGNWTDESDQEDEYEEFEGSGNDDDGDMEDDDEFAMMEYDEEEDDTKSRSEVSPTLVATTVVFSSRSISTPERSSTTERSFTTERSSTTEKSSATESSADDKDNVELIKDDTTESSTSIAPAPRRPRHSQSRDYDYGTIATSSPKPRRRRPYSYKDERRVPYREGYYWGRNLKRTKNSKERPIKPTTTFAPIQPTTESYLKRVNQVVPDTEKAVPATTPVPRRRPKRRKKKVRRQKQSKPQERQVPAETRTAIEAAAAAAAAESLAAESDAFPSPSTTVSTQRTPTTSGIRSVRQNDAGVSIQQSEVNPDGSYSFSYDTADEGRQSREEVGTSDQVVSGRYSFTDAKGRTIHRVYSAGPRGFRAIGDDIARKMDLSQNGPAPIPPPDGRYSPEYDGYSDPNEDPSYEFQYKTDTSARRESADSQGDVKGQYYFFDDDGEKHVVTYFAGAEKGFNVKSAFPDNRIPPGLFFPGRGRVPPRGRSSILQHRNGAYRFTAVGPDSRREECSDSMNYRRGSYVYLDDKGIQRTVVYEAGPNIGFRVIPNPAGLPRCPPAKGDPGWQNVPIQVGVNPPYYRPSTDGFGAMSPTSTYRPWTFSKDPEIDTEPSTYPKTPYEPPDEYHSSTKPVVSSPRPPISRPSSTPQPTYKPTVSTPNGPNSPNVPCPGGSDDCSPSSELPWTPQDKPGRPIDGKPARPIDGKPGRPIDEKPGRPIDGKPGRPVDGKPGRPIDGKPGRPTDGKPGGIPSGRPSTEPPTGSPEQPARRPDQHSSSGGSHNPEFDKTFNIAPVNRYPVPVGSTTLPPRIPTDGLPLDPRPLPSPYPPYHHFSCCRDRLFVDSAIDGHPGLARPIRTYVQSIDLSTEDENGPGRAESPSVALERHVQEHERKASRRQRRRRRRRRRSVP